MRSVSRKDMKVNNVLYLRPSAEHAHFVTGNFSYPHIVMPPAPKWKSEIGERLEPKKQRRPQGKTDALLLFRTLRDSLTVSSPPREHRSRAPLDRNIPVARG